MTRRRRIRLHLLSLLAAAGCAGGAGPPALDLGGAAREPPTSVRDGVYTQAQAERGAAEYSAACSSCHAADLRGNSNAPSLVGSSFLFLWENRSLDELFTSIRRLMPTQRAR